jgi:hypothetical protein
MKVTIRTVATLLALVISSSAALAEPDPANWDAEAVKVIRQMDAYTDSMETFVVDAESYNDASIGEGLVISNPFISKVSVSRPGSIHSITKSGSQTNEVYLHKGKLTVYTDKHKFFTQATIPEVLSDGLMFALDKFDVETPLMDLLLIGSLEYLVSDGEDVIYVTGDSSIRGVECHHVMISGSYADLQIWISKGDKPTPKRTLMTYKQGEGMPRHEVFIEWNATDGFNASEFEFEPPKGAHEIDFIDAP